MTIPSVPTDNIYKFLALTGVFVFLFGLIYPEIIKDEISKEQIMIDEENMKLDFNKGKIKAKQVELTKEIQTLYDKCNCGTPPIISDTAIMWTSVTNGPIELMKISSGIDSLANQWEYLQEIFGETEMKAITKMRLHIEKQNQLIFYRQLQKNILRISAIVSIIGFLLWYSRTQLFQDRILKHQHDDFYAIRICQCCGVPLKNLNWYNELEETQKKKVHFCSDCYYDGKFVEPELTLKQLKQKVSHRCKQLGFNKIQTYLYLSKLKDLSRWTRKFEWEEKKSD